MSDPTRPGFPPNIEVHPETFQNWNWTINVPNLWTCSPQSGDDVVAICNWAAQEGYKVRVRGMMHTWSPLTVVNGTAPDAKLLLVDTTRYLTGMTFIPRLGAQPPQVTVQTGATMEALLGFLEQQPDGQGAAPGYSFPHTPAPGKLTVGGVLAIDAHGTAVPFPGDDFPARPNWVTDLIKKITEGDGALTKELGEFMRAFTDLGLTSLKDLWGPSKNTLLYVKDATLRVTANGYAVHMKKENVQRAVYEFTTKFNELLQAYAGKQQFPVNAPLEIRVTSLDDPRRVGAANAERPTISALSKDAEDEENGWDVALWLDVLTLPGTPYSNQFFLDLEEWIQQNFSDSYAKAMPEWSKGWAYTDQGPWTNQQYMQSIRQMFTTGRSDQDNWNWEVAALRKYDQANLFSNSLLDQLFVPTPMARKAASNQGVRPGEP
jgi:hypothetical protein